MAQISIKDLPREIARLIVREARPRPTCEIKNESYTDQHGRLFKTIEYRVMRGEKLKYRHKILHEYFDIRYPIWRLAGMKEAFGEFFDPEVEEASLYISHILPGRAKEDKYILFSAWRTKEMVQLWAPGYDMEDVDTQDIVECGVYLSWPKYKEALRTMAEHILATAENYGKQ